MHQKSFSHAPFPKNFAPAAGYLGGSASQTPHLARRPFINFRFGPLFKKFPQACFKVWIKYFERSEILAVSDNSNVEA